MSKPRRRAHHKLQQAMSLEQLDEWLQRLEPPPPIDGVSMLDGYLTAVIIGPCSIPPHEWLQCALGPHGRLGFEGTEQNAALMAIVARFNAISQGLADAPERYAPIFERTAGGVVDAEPWCTGFIMGAKLRSEEWRPLCQPGRDDAALLLPILLHCSGPAGQIVLRALAGIPGRDALLRDAYHGIPIVVPAIREYWMPQRVAEIR